MGTKISSKSNTSTETATIVKAYGTQAAEKPLKLFEIERRAPREKDVVIDLLFCGVCHSDIHQARNEWRNTVYPCVPGHEMIGRVMKVGAKVTKFKKGDVAGVGCMVDACRKCSSCREGLEQHCENFPVFSYNGAEKGTSQNTYGGYSESVVVDESFVLKIPKNLDLGAAAPLLCAGITTYSPLKRYGVGQGQKVGIVGLGGLGHMGVKLACALGASVTVITHSKQKEADAKKLGAEQVIISSDEIQMNQYANGFDFVLDTVSMHHNIDSYLNLVKRSGTMVMVGAPFDPLPLTTFQLIFQRRQLAGSLIGGIQETQEMLDFCGKHDIVCDIEKIKINQINEAYERILKSDVRYRFVIDLTSLK